MFSFAELLQTNIINFLIVLLTLRWIVKKARLGDLIQKMADDVRDSVEKSAKDTADALSEYKATKKSTKGTSKFQEEIINEANRNAKGLKEKIEQTTLLKKDEIFESFKKVYQNQNEKFKNATIVDVYRASVDIAQEEVMKRLDEDMHKKIIKSSIEELDRVEGSLS